jgi:hypothetical protein
MDNVYIFVVGLKTSNYSDKRLRRIYVRGIAYIEESFIYV